jgi:uncharacterized protein involved in outer membrane biogenesis
MIKSLVLTPRKKKIAVTVLATLLIYVLFGFIGAPFLVRHILENQVADTINRQVTVGPVRVNPITLSVTLRDLNIQERAGAPFVKLDEAYVNLQTSSLFKWALVLKSVWVVNPEISLVRIGETRFNFSDIGGKKTPEQPDAKESAESSKFSLAIYHTRITGGRITMDDRVVSVSHEIDDLNLNVFDLSSRPADVDGLTRLNLAARINGAAFTLAGQTRPFGPERKTKAEIGLTSFQLPHYLPYLPLPENLVVQSFAGGNRDRNQF